MRPIAFSLIPNQSLSQSLIKSLDLEQGNLDLYKFPDGELYVKIKSVVTNRKIVIIDSLNQPNKKILALIFLIATLRDLGAMSVGMVSPYLAYMRQDSRFSPGEGITANYFAKLLSDNLDWLVTVNPHLHRHKNLNEIYSIPTTVVQATDSIVSWIISNIKDPLLIGPDEESQQWISLIAKALNAPYIVLNKIRQGPKDVEIRVPDLSKYKKLTPVLVDDIISTAQTMIEAVRVLVESKMKAPVCIGVHAIFAGNSYIELQNSGAKLIITCDSIPHPSNGISLNNAIVMTLKLQRGFL